MNYAALTIGPVFETITHTLNDKSKTRRMWAGSYFFSYFMRTLLEKICADSQIDLLVPYAGEGDTHCQPFKIDHNLGIFHDRFIAQSTLDIVQLKKKITEYLENTYKEVSKMIAPEDQADQFLPLSDAMSNHLIVLEESTLRQIDANVIFAINKLLDVQELQRHFVVPNGRKNPIHAYQDRVAKNITLAGRTTNQPVRSTEELAGVTEDGKRLPKTIPYYAVVLSDGDGMSKLIEAHAKDDPTGMVEISKNIYRFFLLDAEENSDTLFDFTNTRYGGELIYGGGDDVLALLPVKNKDTTFLGYLSDINERFKKHLGEGVSMSFGVAIVYHKYPLRDAIKKAQKLLYRAKAYGKAHASPGAASIQLIKHSGQTHHSDQLLNDDTTFEAFKKLTEALIWDTVALPHAIHHSLDRYRKAITMLYRSQGAEASVKPLFDTIFDDVRSDKEKKGIEMLREYFDAVRPKEDKDNESEFQLLFGTLGLMKFLRGGEDE